MQVLALFLTEAHLDHLSAFGVITKARRIGHAHDFPAHQRIIDLQRFGHDRAQRVDIGAIENIEVLAIGEAEWSTWKGWRADRRRQLVQHLFALHRRAPWTCCCVMPILHLARCRSGPRPLHGR